MEWSVRTLEAGQMRTDEKDERIKDLENSSYLRERRGSMKIKAILGGGIQRKLVISFLLLGTIPMVIMGALSYSKTSGILVDQTNVQMKNLTAKGIEQLDSFLTIYKMQMEGLLLPLKSATDYMELGLEIDETRKEMMKKGLADHLKEYPAIRKVRLLDREGNEKFTTLKDKDDQEKESASPWFQKVLNSKEVCLSEMFLSKASNEPI
jgi:hypothetical protein